jgi:hypothetical protein
VSGSGNQCYADPDLDLHFPRIPAPSKNNWITLKYRYRIPSCLFTVNLMQQKGNYTNLITIYVGFILLKIFCYCKFLKPYSDESELSKIPFFYIQFFRIK